MSYHTLRTAGHWSVPETAVQNFSSFFFSCTVYLRFRLSKSTLSIGVLFYKVMSKHSEQMSMGETSSVSKIREQIVAGD